MELKKRIGGFYSVINLLIICYLISIYIWSSNEETVWYSTILYLATVIGISIFILRQGKFTLPRVYIYLILFDLFCLTSYLWAWNQDSVWVMAVRTLPILTIFSILLYNYILYTGQIDFLLKSVYIAGLVLAVYTILSQSGGISGYYSLLTDGIRVGANVNNVNTIGLAVGMSAIIAMYYISYEKKRIHILALPICILVTLGTGSIKAFLLLVMGVVLIAIMNTNPRRKLNSILKIFLWLVITLILFTLLLQLPIFETVNQRFNALLGVLFGGRWIDHSVMVRYSLSQAGLSQFIEKPLFGIGINNGWNISLAIGEGKTYLHNNYIELLVDVGIIGTLLFYAIPVSILWGLWKKIRVHDQKATVVGIIIICWLVVQIGYVSYYDKISYVYFALGAAAIATSGKKAESDKLDKANIR